MTPVAYTTRPGVTPAAARALSPATRALTATPFTAARARTLALRTRPARLLPLLRTALARCDRIPVRSERRASRLKSLDHHALDAALEHAFDVPQEIAFFGAYQRHGLSRTAGTTGTADT